MHARQHVPTKRLICGCKLICPCFTAVQHLHCQCQLFVNITSTREREREGKKNVPRREAATWECPKPKCDRADDASQHPPPERGGPTTQLCCATAAIRGFSSRPGRLRLDASPLAVGWDDVRTVRRTRVGGRTCGDRGAHGPGFRTASKTNFWTTNAVACSVSREDSGLQPDTARAT